MIKILILKSFIVREYQFNFYVYIIYIIEKNKLRNSKYAME